MRLFILISILSSFTCFSQSIVNIDMIAQMSGSTTLQDGSTARIWAFRVNSGPVVLPNSTIDIHVNDSVRLDVFNASQMKHTVHLHGLDVNQANDGVETTSEAINPFSSFTYEFCPKHAGMYFYHCHIESTIHVQLGMYGALIVRPEDEKTAWEGGPSFDREFNWLLSDFDKSWHDSPPINGVIPIFAPDHFLINGKSTLNLDGDTNTIILGHVDEKIYLRIGNMGYGLTKVLFPSEAIFEVLQSDGRPLPNSYFSNSVSLYPGERYEVLYTSDSPINDSIIVNYEDMQGNVLGSNKIPIQIDPAVSLHESETNSNIVYPNPATSNLYIPNTSKHDEVKIFDILGNRLNLEMVDELIDISTLEHGVYLIQIAGQTQKFIKD